MKQFHFPLDRVLRVKRTLLDAQRAKLQQAVAERAQLDRVRDQLNASYEHEARRAASGNVLAGQDLAARGNWAAAVRAQGRRLTGLMSEADQRIAMQKQKCIAFERECTLIEKLRAARLDDWNRSLDREIEELASDSFLAKWNRTER